MAQHYYIDESGNAGDLARTDPGLTFGDQPIFSLAAVGIDDDPLLAADVAQLKIQHRVALSELKASRLHSRPAFIEDLVDLLSAYRAPVLVEVVEKRFMVAIHIVNHQLLTGGHHVGDPTGEALGRALAEYLGQAAPDAVLGGFIDACAAPSSASVIRSLTTLRDWVRGFRPEFELSDIAGKLAGLALDELEPDAGPDHPFSYRRFLPSPDAGPSGKLMWMLPALSSFTNLYARLNQLHGRQLSQVTLIHDEQRYVEGAVRDGKLSMETLRDQMAKITAQFADYQITEAASLRFASSTGAVGLQVADVIAGSIARHMNGVLADPHAPRPLQAVVDKILGFEDGRGQGVNFVATDRLLATAGIHTF
ncbi:MAG: DUF3800 domain-containing protein [Pseudomonadota bacterium]|jgi:hypothetical protein